jgi:peptidoglycan-N-acetylglucosamine deacetylase
VREPWLAALRDPVVLFVHPWEFVDLTRERLRYDCRFRTGDVALRCLRAVIDAFARRGASFVPMCELAT